MSLVKIEEEITLRMKRVCRGCQWYWSDDCYRGIVDRVHDGKIVILQLHKQKRYKNLHKMKVVVKKGTFRDE